MYKVLVPYYKNFLSFIIFFFFSLEGIYSYRLISLCFFISILFYFFIYIQLYILFYVFFQHVKIVWFSMYSTLNSFQYLFGCIISVVYTWIFLLTLNVYKFVSLINAINVHNEKIRQWFLCFIYHSKFYSFIENLFCQVIYEYFLFMLKYFTTFG